MFGFIWKHLRFDCTATHIRPYYVWNEKSKLYIAFQLVIWSGDDMKCSTATETKLICIHKVLTVNRYLILFDWYSSQIVSHQFDCSNDSRSLLEKGSRVSCDFNIRKCSLVLIETMSPQWRLLSLYYRDSLLYARLDFYRLCDIRTFHNIQRKFTQGTEGA